MPSDNELSIVLRIDVFFKFDSKMSDGGRIRKVKDKEKVSHRQYLDIHHDQDNDDPEHAVRPNLTELDLATSKGPTF